MGQVLENAKTRAMAETIDRALVEIGAADQKICADDLQQALGLKSAYLAKRFFSVLDVDGNGLLDREELYQAVRVLEAGDFAARSSLLFALHDGDDDGYVLQIEIERMIHIGMAENRLELPQAVVDRLLDALFSKVDRDGDGRITLPEFTDMFRRHPEVVENMCEGDLGRLIGKFRAQRDKQSRGPGWLRRLSHRLEASAAVWLFLGVYGLINVLLFLGAANHYADAGANVLVQLARGCGACLNFNGALILVPMMRRLITWMRRRPIARYLPVDEAVAFHRLVGHALFGFAVVHTICHLLNYTVVSFGDGPTV
ncbi:MAG: EF-hand domain-containing protein, partial [Nannocystaceae bacterium]